MINKESDYNADDETIKKASGRGKPGKKPEIPKGIPKDNSE